MYQYFRYDIIFLDIVLAINPSWRSTFFFLFCFWTLALNHNQNELIVWGDKDLIFGSF